MARACSTEATVQFFHTMNWVRDVKGASHLDYILHVEDEKEQAKVGGSPGGVACEAWLCDLGVVMPGQSWARRHNTLLAMTAC